ncbi:MAG: type II toxin-antitoxin system VapC family toxin [Candidatus Acidiferrales bacterium]
MKLLLDTHIWIWSLSGEQMLSTRVETALKDPANQIWLSPVSIWELMILVQKNRVKLGEELDRWVEQSWEILPVKEAALTWEVALAVPSIRLPHRDPADAFIAATAKVYELTLVTSDLHLRSLKGISVLKY